MASIRSVLIKTCMENIQKEMNHLEHWLHHLPEQGGATPVNVKDELQETRTSMDLHMIHQAIDKISKQLSVQQLTLNHITDRIEILESTRDVRIEKQMESSPWLGSLPDSNDSVHLEENEVDELEPIIHVVHMQENESSSPQEQSDQQEEEEKEKIRLEQEQKKKQEEEEKEKIRLEELKKRQEEEEKEKIRLEQEQKKKQEEEEKEKIRLEQEQKKKQEEEKNQEVVEEEEEVVEEEEEVFSEIEYKGVTYYIDSSNQVYSVDEEGQPSEMAIGFWKEKSQTIAFYKVK